MSFQKALDSFVGSGKQFALVYTTSNAVLASSGRILVLDSSFNPPHLGHFTLAKTALDYKFDAHATQLTKPSLLLLLSVKNADKIHPEPASFAHRLSMMRLLAQSFESMNINVGIGLTTHARFADKARTMTEFFANSPACERTPRLTFLVGFDTLIRVLDPKYYQPQGLSEALSEFMSTSDIFCLTRAENAESYAKQHEYVDKIACGEFPTIPSSWSQNIHLQTLRDGRDDIGKINSSGIRERYRAGGDPQYVPTSVNEYIKSNKLYTE